MKKISLTEAHKLLSKGFDDNAFAAYVKSNETKSITKLNFLKNLYIAVKVAEKAAGIDNLKHKLDVLTQYDLEYFDFMQKNIYYKENLPATLIESVKDKQQELLEEYKLLKALIEEKSADVYVEV